MDIVCLALPLTSSPPLPAVSLTFTGGRPEAGPWSHNS